MKTLWWYFVKYWVKTSLFFYSKKIRVSGKENIPKKGAVLFLVNHPNGLIDPLIVAVNNPRIQHFLVKAGAFKSPTVKKILGSLNLMPIYRIRDGVQSLGKNQEIFEKCYSLFSQQKAVMIFPEGTHNRKRTVRNLSKGFTRIVFGALEQHPDLQIQLVPVGLTYQNASVFPAKIALHYGTPILANPYYDPENQANKIKELKEVVSAQLRELSVHIPDDENYESNLEKLNEANVDFTKVNDVNTMIKTRKIHGRKRKIHLLGFLKVIIILNTLLPWLIWKNVDRKNEEIEFVDTFRFGFNLPLAPLFYFIQAYLVSIFFDWKTAAIYFGSSLLIVLLYSKFHPTPAE